MCYSVPYSFFFFSSRRRHTRLTCDWSSDVCSSDLSYRLSVLPDPGLGVIDQLGHHKVAAAADRPRLGEIGRASCRGRGEMSGGGVLLKKKRKGEEKGEICRYRAEHADPGGGGWMVM